MAAALLCAVAAIVIVFIYDCEEQLVQVVPAQNFGHHASEQNKNDDDEVMNSWRIPSSSDPAFTMTTTKCAFLVPRVTSKLGAKASTRNQRPWRCLFTSELNYYMGTRTNADTKNAAIAAAALSRSTLSTSFLQGTSSSRWTMLFIKQ